MNLELKEIVIKFKKTLFAIGILLAVVNVFVVVNYCSQLYRFFSTYRFSSLLIILASFLITILLNVFYFKTANELNTFAKNLDEDNLYTFSKKYRILLTLILCQFILTGIEQVLKYF